MGSAVGAARIREVLALCKFNFLDDMSNHAKQWIGKYFPRRGIIAPNVIFRSGNGMAEDAIAGITVTKNAVRLASSPTLEVRRLRRGGTEVKRYTKAVERMTGKNWSNVNTVEHPYSALYTHLKIIIKSVYVKHAQVHGLIQP